jgi:hypothetical protein
MKKVHSLLLLGVVSLFLTYCQKDMSGNETQQQKNEKKVVGKWIFVSFTDSNHVTTTSENPCYADDRLELKDNHTAVISQGDCIEFKDKERDLEFSWNFISDDVVNMGSDTVKLTVFNDTALQFYRTSPSFLEYHWKR